MGRLRSGFDAASAISPLISPFWIPATDAALEQHDNDEGSVAYTPDALGRLVRMAMRRLAKAGGLASEALKNMTTDELVQLINTSAHAFRAERRRMLEAAADYHPIDAE